MNGVEAAVRTMKFILYDDRDQIVPAECGDSHEFPFT
jgi:hypothetical protein